MTQNSRKGAQAFATGNFNKGLNGVLGTINAGAQKVGKKMKRDKSRKGFMLDPEIVDGKSPMEYLKMEYAMHNLYNEKVVIDSGDERKAMKYLFEEARDEGESYEEYVRRIASDYDYKKNELGILGGRNGSRKGSAIGAHGAFCDCPECGPAGHGSRPANLGEIATKISLGRNRSIGSPTAVEEEPTTEAPETQEQTREGGFLRSVGKALTNGAKVVGNGIHAAADELVAGGKDALNDKSTDFENVSSKIRNTPGGTKDEAAEKAGTPSGTQSAGNNDIASRVMNGEFGNGEARTKALTDAGYDPQEVQSQVNSRLKSKMGSRKGSRKGFGFGYHQVVLHEISPKQITSIPGGGVVHHEGQVYKIEGLPEFEPNEWIHKLVIWTDNDPDWDYSYDHCDWE